MTATTFEQAVDAAVEEAFRGYRGRAAKRGRSADRPWVPVIEYPCARYGTATTQVLGKAFVFPVDARECAEKSIDAARKVLRDQLLTPRCRSLREHHGLPREIPVEVEP